MDYFLHKINKRIETLISMGDDKSLVVHYQSRIEYLLILMLGYLWNKKFDLLDSDEKESLFSSIISPSIGSIVSVIRSLDIDKEICGSKKFNNVLNDYPTLRNQLLGHGYVYEDALEKNEIVFRELYEKLLQTSTNFLSTDMDIVLVGKKDNKLYHGLLFKSDETESIPWNYPVQNGIFEEGSIYITIDGKSYYCISPFVKVENFGDDIFIFNKISEKLTGRIHYNKLIRTGTCDCEWSPFSNLTLLNDGIKIKTANGTIRNIYDNNYTKFIDVSYRKELLEFLEKNKASVCATLWGHGGIGKTAVIQNVCEYFFNKENRTFDYVIFLSAKDRKYNYYKGVIEELSSGISTFEDVISSINKIVFEDDTIREDLITGYQGKMLIVIDDYESLTKEEASRISELITKLDVAHHKVVITTRAANVCIGQEIKTSELTQSATIDFLYQVFENESILLSQKDKSNLSNQKIQKKIHAITSGRPIFIFQLAFVVGSQGLAKAIKTDIKGGDAAIEFLYGRLYNYLSSVAKDVFVTIGLLTTPEDMMNVTDKLQYVLNMENDSDGFNRAFDELKKLKIVKTVDEEGKYFEVYSKELQEMMNQQLSKRDSSFIGGCKRRRDQINKDKNLDIEHSLLNNANAGRYAKNEIEVVDSYKQIINRQSCPIEVKLQAASYLTSYLILERGKRNDALDLYEKYSHIFSLPSNKFVMVEYSLRWANACWSSGSKSEKQKAISILSDYMKNGVDLDTNLDLELMGTLLMFKSLSLLTEWRELRDKKNFGEISITEFRQVRNEQKKDCNLIYSAIGNPLYTNISRKKLIEFPSGTRQAIITGLYNYIEVLIRINKKDEAIEICDYVCICGPNNFHAQFLNRKNWLKTLS